MGQATPHLSSRNPLVPEGKNFNSGLDRVVLTAHPMKLRLFLPLLLALVTAAHAADFAVEARKAQLAYAQKLDQLLTQAKAAGDKDAVKEIEGMIAQVEKKEPDGSKNDVLPSGDETTKWAWGSGGELTLQGNGKAKHSAWAKSGTWKRGANQTLVIVSDTGVAFEVKFDANGIGKVKSVGGDSATTMVRKP